MSDREIRAAGTSSVFNILRSLVSLAVSRLPPGILTDKQFFARYEQRGYHVTPVHFYQPIPNSDEIAHLWDGPPSQMPGVKMPLDEQRKLLEELRPFMGEFDNRVEGFGGCDAAVLYGMVRRFRPKRIVEIGSGGSTHIAAAAMRKNGSGSITAVDPAPRHDVTEALRGIGKHIPERVETVAFSHFAELAADDILFIDSSHTVRIGGDVTHEVLEILPRVAPGVLVHVHDIFLPAHYPKRWVLENRIFWAEQYLIQAFLAFNDSWEVLWCAGSLHVHAPDVLCSIVPQYRVDAEPQAGSLWLRRVR